MLAAAAEDLLGKYAATIVGAEEFQHRLLELNEKFMDEIKDDVSRHVRGMVADYVKACRPDGAPEIRIIKDRTGQHEKYEIRKSAARAEVLAAQHQAVRVESAVAPIEQRSHSDLQSQREVDDKFATDVRESLVNPSGRKLRLKSANPKPQSIYTVSRSFLRNPDVVAEVLERANGQCECCKAAAPFLRAADGTPYLEVHHIVFLADNGEDTVENAEALCPNCHRQKHHG